MDSEALETFLAVHRCGGVSAAAGALSRTQSAISRRLALLEQEIGVPLFERIGRGLTLSEVGAALLPYAERVAAAIGDAKAVAQAAQSGAVALVQMVTVGTLANAALAAALQRARARHRGLDLRLHTATSAEVSDQVRSGAATLGLRYFEDRAPDLVCRVIAREQMVVACAATHPRAGKRVKSLAQLANERWLAFPAQEGRHESHAAHVFAQFLTRGVDRIDWVAIDGLTAQKRLVEAGFGLALMQANAIEDELAHGTLSTLRVDDLDLSVPVALVLRKGGFLSTGAHAVIDELEHASLRASARHHPRAGQGSRRQQSKHDLAHRRAPRA